MQPLQWGIMNSVSKEYLTAQCVLLPRLTLILAFSFHGVTVPEAGIRCGCRQLSWGDAQVALNMEAPQLLGSLVQVCIVNPHTLAAVQSA